MNKKRKWSPVPTPLVKTQDPLAILTEGKLSGEDKEENTDLLLVMWSVALESNTQGPKDKDWVRLAKDVLVWATKVMELDSLRSSLHLRNSLKRADLSVAKTDEWGFAEDGSDRGSVCATAADRGGQPRKA